MGTAIACHQEAPGATVPGGEILLGGCFGCPGHELASRTRLSTCRVGGAVHDQLAELRICYIDVAPTPERRGKHDQKNHPGLA